MSISLQSSFNALSRVIEQFESDGNAVRRVEAATPTTKSETGAQPLTATIYTPLSSQLQPLGTNDESTDVDSDSEVDSTRITAEMTDGRVCISYMLPSLRPPEIDISVKIQSVDAEVSGDEIILRIEVDIGERYANSNPTSDESTTAESRLDNRDHGDESDTENSRMRYKSHKSSDSAWSPRQLRAYSVGR